MGRQSAQGHLLIDCNPTQTIKFIVPCLHKQGHLIFRGLHQVAQYHAAWQRAAGFQLGGFAWREAVITGALPEVPLLVLPSDGWRVLPADLQVYPPIWRAGGRLANTLYRSLLQILLLNLCWGMVEPVLPWALKCHHFSCSSVFTKSCLLSLSGKTTCLERPHNSVITLYSAGITVVLFLRVLWSPRRACLVTVRRRMPWRVCLPSRVSWTVWRDAHWRISLSWCRNSTDVYKRRSQH